MTPYQNNLFTDLERQKHLLAGALQQVADTPTRDAILQQIDALTEKQDRILDVVAAY